MTRSLISVAAAAALLGSGYAPSSPRIIRLDDWNDDDPVASAKRKALAEASRRESEARRETALKRTEEYRQQRLAEQARKVADLDKLRAGIDPTNDRPLSRQQRRALYRRNFQFASADTHPKDGDSTQIEAPLVSGAVPKADAQNTTQPPENPC